MKNSLHSSPWRTILPVGLALALSLSGDLTLYAILPANTSALSIDLYAVGILLSANRLVRFLTNPLVGMLVDRWGQRRLLLTGLALGTVSTLIYALAPGFWLFLLGRLLWGCSWSLIYIGALSAGLDVVAEKERGWGSGVLQTFYYAGLFVNPLVGGLLSDRLGFSTTFAVCAAISGLGLLEAALFLPKNMPAASRLIPALSPSLVMHTSLAAINRLRGSMAGWTRKNSEVIGAYAINLLTLFVSEGVITATITLYLVQNYGEKLTIGGLILTAAAAGGGMLALRALVSAAVAPLAGKLSDLGGRRWLVVGCGLTFGIGGCMLLGLGSRFWLVALGVALAAVSNGMIMAVLPAIATGTGNGLGKGASLGLLATSGDIGCAIAPLAVYAMVERVDLKVIYLATAGPLVFGLVATVISAKWMNLVSLLPTRQVIK